MTALCHASGPRRKRCSRPGLRTCTLCLDDVRFRGSSRPSRSRGLSALHQLPQGSSWHCGGTRRQSGDSAEEIGDVRRCLLTMLSFTQFLEPERRENQGEDSETRGCSLGKSSLIKSQGIIQFWRQLIAEKISAVKSLKPSGIKCVN